MAHPELQAIPLIFSFRQLVAGDGFLAGVRMDGRALLETELAADGREESWITGIAPVGIAGGGGDRSVAFVEFRNAWIEVVFDLASKASSFEEFHASCTSFLASEQSSVTSLWEAAVAAVRREGYIDPSLRKESADKQVTYEVVDLTHVKPAASENHVETGLQMAA